MSSEKKNIDKIQKFKSHNGLLKLWNRIKKKSTPKWHSGKAFEYLILRAFELEGAEITWPYSVSLFGENVEQIDGAILITQLGIISLVESKDLKENVNIEPIAKLRNQLLRRPSGCVGSVFSTTGFTEPAITLAHFVQPQSIILWEKDNIEFCLKNKNFINGFIKKYKANHTSGIPNFDLTI